MGKRHLRSLLRYKAGGGAEIQEEGAWGADSKSATWPWLSLADGGSGEARLEGIVRVALHAIGVPLLADTPVSFSPLARVTLPPIPN